MQAVAAVAADAGNHIFASAFQQLLAVVVVGDEGTGCANHVGLAGGDGFFNDIGVLETADGNSNDGAAAGFDGCSHFQRGGNTAGVEAHGMSQIAGGFTDLEHVHNALCDLCKAHRVLDGPAALFLSGEDDFDQEVGAEFFTDGTAEHHGEPGTVFQTAAELVGSLIGQGRQELGAAGQAVGHMYGGTVEAEGLIPAQLLQGFLNHLLHLGTLQLLAGHLGHFHHIGSLLCLFGPTGISTGAGHSLAGGTGTAGATGHTGHSTGAAGATRHIRHSTGTTGSAGAAKAFRHTGHSTGAAGSTRHIGHSAGTTGSTKACGHAGHSRALYLHNTVALRHLGQEGQDQLAVIAVHAFSQLAHIVIQRGIVKIIQGETADVTTGHGSLRGVAPVGEGYHGGAILGGVHRVVDDLCGGVLLRALQEVGHGGGAEVAVFQNHVADLQRFECMIVAFFHNELLSVGCFQHNTPIISSQTQSALYRGSPIPGTNCAADTAAARKVLSESYNTPNFSII